MGSTIHGLGRTPSIAGVRAPEPASSPRATFATAPVRTSFTHPLQVSYVASGVAGKIGMTICPGKGGPSKSEHTWQRSLDADLERLKKNDKCDVLVSLIEDFELNLLQIPGLVEKGTALGIHVERFPIKDVSIPQMDPTIAEVAKLKAWVEEGKNLVIHCRGGNGRTGLVAACLLIALGKSPGNAIKAVRNQRPKAIETKQQEQFVYDFATKLGVS